MMVSTTASSLPQQLADHMLDKMRQDFPELDDYSVIVREAPVHPLDDQTYELVLLHRFSHRQFSKRIQFDRFKMEYGTIDMVKMELEYFLQTAIQQLSVQSANVVKLKEMLSWL